MRWIWIDRFEFFQPGRSARAVKNVSLAEEHLHDHFPGVPLHPPSLILEGMAQTGGIVVADALEFRRKVVLAKVSRFECFDAPRPGDQIRYEATVVGEVRPEGAATSVVATRGDERIAEAEIMFAALDAGDAGAGSVASEGRDFARELTQLLGLESAKAAAAAHTEGPPE